MFYLYVGQMDYKYVDIGEATSCSVRQLWLGNSREHSKITFFFRVIKYCFTVVDYKVGDIIPLIFLYAGWVGHLQVVAIS